MISFLANRMRDTALLLIQAADRIDPPEWLVVFSRDDGDGPVFAEAVDRSENAVWN